MKAIELQLGDYISYNGKIIKVASITNKKVGYHTEANDGRLRYARLCECKPIPLKKVHLAKNGFKADEADEIFIYTDAYEVRVTFYGGDKELGLEPYIYLNINFAEKCAAMEIENLHQLQHAMRIMGCDKTIEL